MKTKTTVFAVLSVTAMFASVTHAQSYTFTTLVTFDGTNGGFPSSGLVFDASGNLYGTTHQGYGPNNDGTLFKIAAGTNALTTLVDFAPRGNDGSSPGGELVFDGNGNLFGATGGGGTNALGLAYKYSIGTGLITTIANFGDATIGYSTAGFVRDARGNLYGTNSSNGANTNQGTVFKIDANTNALSPLATFTGANGASPRGGVTFDASGNLYGVTYEGGASNLGTVFKISAGTGTFTTIATFTGANGAQPNSGVVLDGLGNIYGTTYRGGLNNDGTVFKIAASTGILTTLATFTGAGAGNGAMPSGGMAIDGNGNLFGTTYDGGTNNRGTVFKVDTGTGTLTTIATLSNALGSFPYSRVILDGSGNLYGTTSGGGATFNGTVFKLIPNAATPEPSALLLLAPGALGTIFARRRSAADRGNGRRQR